MCERVIIVFIVLDIELVVAPNGGHPIIVEKVCKDNEKIIAIKEFGVGGDGESNQYLLVVDYDYKPFSLVVLKFDLEGANVTAIDDTPATIISNPKDRQFHVIFTKPSNQLRVRVQGPRFGRVPYATSIQVNSVEICDDNLTGYIDKHKNSNPEEPCGRRKIDHTELIVNGWESRPGDWPWHAAIYEVKGSKTNFICGGTLLSETFVLTAAHCVTSGDIAVLPENRKVVLGKYNLVGEDVAPQERDVCIFFDVPKLRAFKLWGRQDRIQQIISSLLAGGEVNTYSTLRK